MNRLSEQVDILLDIAQTLAEQQAFGTIAALALLDLEHQDIVQPFLKRLQRKVVLNLADFRWLPKERYSDIQILECTYSSALPVNPHIRNHNFAYLSHAAGLRPWLITFYGRPHPFISTFRTLYFPTVSVVRVVEQLGQIELQRIGSPYSTFGNTMVAHHLARGLWGVEAPPTPTTERNVNVGLGMACDLRYRCHQDQEVGFRAACPGQIWSMSEVVTSNGHRMHASVWRLSEENTAASFIKDVLQEHPREHFCIPSGTKYRSIQLDMQIELLPSMTRIPDESFKTLREMAESRAKAHLDQTNPDAKLDLRVFVIGQSESHSITEADGPSFSLCLASTCVNEF